MFNSSICNLEKTTNICKTEEVAFLKIRCIVKLDFLKLRFWTILVFSETHGFDRNVCLDVWTVVNNQQKMFESEKDVSRNGMFVHATVFLTFNTVRNAYMSRIWCTGNRHLLAPIASRRCSVVLLWYNVCMYRNTDTSPLYLFPLKQGFRRQFLATKASIFLSWWDGFFIHLIIGWLSNN